MKKILVLFLISVICFSVFMACKKSAHSSGVIICNCPNLSTNKWQWVSTQNGSGQISYPTADSKVLLTLAYNEQYIAAVNGKDIDSGGYLYLNSDTLKMSPFIKPTGGLTLPDSLYHFQFGADSLYLTTLPNSSSGNIKISFVLQSN